MDRNLSTRGRRSIVAPAHLAQSLDAGIFPAMGETKVPLVPLLALSFTLNIVGVSWGLPNYLDWTTDTVAPFRVLQAAYYKFSPPWWDKYPPVHFLTVAAFSAPLIGYLVLSGGLDSPSRVFPFGLTDPLSAFTQLILISRVVSALMGVAIVLLVYLTVRELFDRRSAIFAALIVALYHPLVYYAHTGNFDVPYLFWSMLAIYSFVKVLKRGGVKDYVLFALFATLAICTKDQAYGLFLLSPLPILWARFKARSEVSDGRRNPADVIFDRRHVIAALVAVATFIVAQNLIFNLSGFIKHVRFITGPGTEEYQAYASTLLDRLRLLRDTIAFLASGLTPPLFAACLVGSLSCAVKFPRLTLPLLFLALSYYLIFLNVLLNVQPRFVMPIAIVTAFFGGKLLADLWEGARWKLPVRAAIALAFAYAALFTIQLDVLFLRDSRYAAEEWMRARFGKGAVVETFAPHKLHDYYPRFPSWVRVRSGDLAEGMRWQPLPLRPDRVQMPNLYAGRDVPDYIVLSEFWYSRFLTPPEDASREARALLDLLHGRTEYRLAAAFKTPTWVPIRDLAINPRILIFERRPSFRQAP